MTHTPCAPSAPAENGSLHWVSYPDFGMRVWLWRPHGFCGMGVWNEGNSANAADYLTEVGWRYVGPASHDDASELAKALTDLSSERSLNDELGRIVQDHCVTITALRAQIAALQAANEEMRARIKSERDACLKIAHEECMGTTHGKGAWKVMQAFLKIRARIEARAALASSSADGEGK